MPLDNDQITEIRRMLEQKREDLTGESEPKEDTKKPTKKTTTKKTTKKAQKTTPRRKLNPIESAVAHELTEVDGALQRLDEQQHRFGYCERCFMEIPWSELVTSPSRRCCNRCT